jgi:NADH-quinone oxidoreductase subunit M
VLALVPQLPDQAARWTWVAVTLADLGLVAAAVGVYTAPPSGGLALEERLRWIPSVNSSYHVGVDGLSLPLVAFTALLFCACAIYALRERRRPRAHAALFCFLQCTCLGLFIAQDLILFFVWFDLSIVGMYFAIAGWGHGDARRSALKFFLYTFLGSLALLVGFIGLYLAADPHTFDIPELAAAAPLVGNPVAGGFVLAALLLGLAVKTPTVPFHTWLPPAHTDASAIGSAVLAGVLLKMGTYGFVRIAMPVLPHAWQAWSWVILAVGVVSVLYGALVALAQDNVKRMIAYTSVNHMGYVVLGVAAAGFVSSGAQARQLAVTGAVTQMVSHGLITGALFLLAGVLADRRDSYAMDSYGGLARTAPRYAALFAVAAFASLGLPAFSGFIAEFQVFTGAIGAAAIAAVALPGILITAALFLRAVQRLLTGPTAGHAVGFTDVTVREAVPIGGLLVLALLIGIAPAPLLDLITPASTGVVELVGR